ncbi:hypothetical protein BJX61DRAFT_155169 [Aspergillus egyptiacus]|nr:hypothetical protein BJX61DRAFT_155169 [Aspergillus egyptiacus]
MLTVFADIHYYFTAPTPKPLLHRFDKSSYLYLYHNAAQQKTRIEVANHPGTADQDAFNGGLDNVHLRHSTSFPTLCTLTVDGQTPTQGVLTFPPPPGSVNSYEWQLPVNDHRGENAIQRLHTLDIYFWTQGDADQFLDLAERYLSRDQQLENVAITDPAYQNGRTRNSQSETVLSPAPIGIPPPPPLSGQTPSHQHTSSASPPSAEQKRDSAQFAPLPYNPAAPAAPEPIKHREKTPPPPDAADGTGLAAAIAADNGAPYQNPSQIPGGGGYSSAPPPPQSQATAASPLSLPGSYVSPPPSAGLSHAGSFPPQTVVAPIHSTPGVPSYPPQAVQSPPVSSYPHSYLPGGVQHQQHMPMNPYGVQPQPQQPQPQQVPSFYGTQVPSIGGYSTYSYDQAPKHHSRPSVASTTTPTPGSGTEYDIHNQMYRPTEAEANSHLQDHAKLAMQNPGQRPRKLEDKAARVEGSVNRFLKKLEKKL